MRTSSIFNSQHVATRCNRVAKCVQHVPIVWPELANCGPTMLGYVASGAHQWWAPGCVETLRSFGRGLREDKLLSYMNWCRCSWNLKDSRLITIETDIHCTPVIRGGREGAYPRWGRFFCYFGRAGERLFGESVYYSVGAHSVPLGNWLSFPRSIRNLRSLS